MSTAKLEARVAALERMVALLAAGHDDVGKISEGSNSNGSGHLEIDSHYAASINGNLSGTNRPPEIGDDTEAEIASVAGICNDDPNWDDFLLAVAGARREAEAAAKERD